MSHEGLYRLGIAGALLTQLIFIPVVLLLHKLFQSQNRDRSQLMVILALVSIPVAMLSSLFQIAALMRVDQAGEMMFFLNLNAQGIVIASIFWGLWLFPLGQLIYNSALFPRLIGIAVIIGGIGYTLNAFTKLLWPDLQLLPSIFEVMTIGEVIWMLWLTIFGARWSKLDKERAPRAQGT